MKKFFTLTCLSMLQLLCFAQNPGFYYQGVAKMKNGAPITNQSISIYISILSSSPDKLYYKESHSVKTDESGRFSLVVGEGTEVQGKFIEIDWRSKELWIQTEMDAGLGVEDMGKSRILPVPVANYALKTPYDYNISASLVSNTVKQGEKGGVTIALRTYLYDHEPVQVFVDNKASGINISPINFTLLGNDQLVTIVPDRNSVPGTYEIPYSAKAASGKERKGKFLFTVIEDSLSKYLTGKWNVVVKRTQKPDTSYIEEIVAQDSLSIKFTNNKVVVGGLPLLYNYVGKISKFSSYYRLEVDNVPYSNPSIENSHAEIYEIYNLKSFTMTVSRISYEGYTSTRENHYLTFTRIE